MKGLSNMQVIKKNSHSVPFTCRDYFFQMPITVAITIIHCDKTTIHLFYDVVHILFPNFCNFDLLQLCLCVSPYVLVFELCNCVWWSLTHWNCVSVCVSSSVMVSDLLQLCVCVFKCDGLWLIAIVFLSVFTGDGLTALKCLCICICAQLVCLFVMVSECNCMSMCLSLCSGL